MIFEPKSHIFYNQNKYFDDFLTFRLTALIRAIIHYISYYNVIIFWLLFVPTLIISIL